MVVLKRIKAASLLETLVATVLIVVVFMIASLSLNTVFKNHVVKDDHQLQQRIKELTYLYINDKLNLPYTEEKVYWEIYVYQNGTKTVTEINNKKTQQTKEVSF